VAAQVIGTVTAESDTVTVGDPVTLTLKFTAPPDYRLGSLLWSVSSDTLVTLDTLKAVKVADSSWTCRINVALFAPWAWILAALLLLGGGALFWYLRRPRALVVASAPAALPPWETAKAELDGLAAKGYHLRGEPRLFAIELSEIVRRYLQGRYGFVALEQTTSEVKFSLKHIDITDPQREGLLETLTACDLAKYAKFHWPAPELTRALSGARAFVDQTTPLPEPEVEPS